jgi:hypothetical protein
MQGTQATTQHSNFSVFLLGAILNILAAVDYVSLIDYSLKAILGGMIWLGFKIIGDKINERMKKKQKELDKEDE